jgi:tRNA (guanine37-N1)-methyltransferase
VDITVLTLFPELLADWSRHSIIGRAQDKGILRLSCVNLRDYSGNKHGHVDDYLYGGGAGMLIRPDVVVNALRAMRRPESHTVYFSPRGPVFDQNAARRLAREQHLLLLCGHYEGLDERGLSAVDEELSLGDFVLTGGELPAMAVIDAVSRLLPGVLGDDQSAVDESFQNQLLEQPQYTRPEIWEGEAVPPVLLSGHHEAIRRWRKRESLRQTLLKRPDLLLNRDYDEEEKQLLQDILWGEPERDA